jgi:hypothetical protein
MVRRSALDHPHAPAGWHEYNLLLASLRRVEIQVSPRPSPTFSRWKNRMQQ